MHMKRAENGSMGLEKINPMTSGKTKRQSRHIAQDIRIVVGTRKALRVVAILDTKTPSNLQAGAPWRQSA